MALDRIDATAPARAHIRSLIARHGPLMFHLSGGCCDGSAPMCFARGELRLGARDVLLGTIEDCPFYVGADQWERWQHTTLTLDLVEGRGASFSLEAPDGVRFLIRSDVCAVPSAAGDRG